MNRSAFFILVTATHALLPTARASSACDSIFEHIEEVADFSKFGTEPYYRRFLVALSEAPDRQFAMQVSFNTRNPLNLADAVREASVAHLNFDRNRVAQGFDVRVTGTMSSIAKFAAHSSIRSVLSFGPVVPGESAASRVSRERVAIRNSFDAAYAQTANDLIARTRPTEANPNLRIFPNATYEGKNVGEISSIAARAASMVNRTSNEDFVLLPSSKERFVPIYHAVAVDQASGVIRANIIIKDKRSERTPDAKMQEYVRWLVQSYGERLSTLESKENWFYQSTSTTPNSNVQDSKRFDGAIGHAAYFAKQLALFEPVTHPTRETRIIVALDGGFSNSAFYKDPYLLHALQGIMESSKIPALTITLMWSETDFLNITASSAKFN